MISGFQHLTVVQGDIWVGPHESAILGDIPYYENPCSHGARSFVNEPGYAAVAAELNMPARVVGNIYTRREWHNATFDYNEIDLTGWPLITHKDAKRRNEFRKIRERGEQLGLSVAEINLDSWMKLLPRLDYDDSVAVSLIPIIEAQRAGEMSGRMIPVEYRDHGGHTVGLSLIELIDGVLFNYALVTFPGIGFNASDLTYALGAHAVELGATHMDLWNVVLTQREGYKRSFFTGPRQAFCWASQSVLNQYDWMHPLPATL